MKTREKQLIKNTAIVAVGKICTQFVSFFLLPLYTSLLSAAEYGVVDLINTYISLLIPIFFFQIDQAVFRFLIDVREDREKKSDIVTSVLATVTVQAVVFLGIFVLLHPLIQTQFKYYLAVNVIASMYSSVLLQISRGLGDNMSYSVASLLTGAGTIVLNVLFIAVFHWGARGMLLAMVIANALGALYVFLRKHLYRYLDLKYLSLSSVKSMWHYSIPLIPNQLSWWVVNVSDRLIIQMMLGLSFNGIYSAANKFSAMIITLFNVFNITWTESAAVHFKDEDNAEYFSNIMNVTLRVFISALIGVMALMPAAFGILIPGAEYQSAYEQIPILLLSTLFNIAVAMLGSVYVALKKTNEIAKTSIIAAAVNLSVNFLLIRFIGLYAASISTVVAYLSMAVYRFVDVQKYVKIKLEWGYLAVSCGAFAASACIYYNFRGNLWVCAVDTVTAVLFAIFSLWRYGKSLLGRVPDIG